MPPPDPRPPAGAHGPAAGPVRRFLFLQGPTLRFFDRLAGALARRGHVVRRVNFNGGDRISWRRPGAVDFRGRPAEWPRFLADLIATEAITDLVLFGDCRPLHRAAIETAAREGVRVLVFEEGYLRPNWITLEEGGVNGHSRLPRDPAWYRLAAATLPEREWGSAVPSPSFSRRVLEVMAYYAACIAMAGRYPHYRTHRPVPPLREGLGWLRLLLVRRARRRAAEKAFAALTSGGAPYFLMPLQLDADYQLRQHSPFGGMEPAIERAVASFAAHAAAPTRLALKGHPLDNGLRNWERVVRETAERYGVADRVIYFEGGDLARAIAESRGVVTINSTVGALALRLGKPVIALGRAVYALPGLTFQGALDAFWQAPAPPDAELYAAFERVLKAGCLVRGGFFGGPALEAAVEEAAARLAAPVRAKPAQAGLPLPAELAAEPPRRSAVA